MSYLINNQQNLNEIIFAKRNKNYGAYAIRSEYGNTIAKSLSIMMFGFGAIMSVAYYFNNRNNGPKKQEVPFIQDSVYVVEVDTRIKENKPVTPETSPKTEAGKKTDATSTTIIDTTSVQTNSVEIEHVTTSNGTSTTSTIETPNGGGDTGTNTGSIAATGITGNEIADPTGVDSPPEFEGGLRALYQFVSKNLKYPPIAIEEGKSGTLYVKFVVDEKGKVCNLTLQNNIGYGLDQEALRVVGLIPNFKTPAKVKGQAVKVYYQLPIKFKYTN